MSNAEQDPNPNLLEAENDQEERSSADDRQSEEDIGFDDEAGEDARNNNASAASPTQSWFSQDEDSESSLASPPTSSGVSSPNLGWRPRDTGTPQDRGWAGINDLAGGSQSRGRSTATGSGTPEGSRGRSAGGATPLSAGSEYSIGSLGSADGQEGHNNNGDGSGESPYDPRSSGRLFGGARTPSTPTGDGRNTESSMLRASGTESALSGWRQDDDNRDTRDSSFGVGNSNDNGDSDDGVLRENSEEGDNSDGGEEEAVLSQQSPIEPPATQDDAVMQPEPSAALPEAATIEVAETAVATPAQPPAEAKVSASASTDPGQAKAQRKVAAKNVPKTPLPSSQEQERSAAALSAKQTPTNAQPKAATAAAAGSGGAVPPPAAGAKPGAVSSTPQAKTTPRVGTEISSGPPVAQAKQSAPPPASAQPQAKIASPPAMSSSSPYVDAPLTGKTNPYQLAAAAKAAPGGATASAAAAAAVRVEEPVDTTPLEPMPPRLRAVRETKKPLSTPPAPPPFANVLQAKNARRGGNSNSSLAKLMQKEDQLLKATLNVSAQLSAEELEFNPHTGAMVRKTSAPQSPNSPQSGGGGSLASPRSLRSQSPRDDASRSQSPRQAAWRGNADRYNGEMLEDAAARMQAIAIKVNSYRRVCFQPSHPSSCVVLLAFMLQSKLYLF